MDILILETGATLDLHLVLEDSNEDLIVEFADKTGAFENNLIMAFDDLTPELQDSYDNIGDDYAYMTEANYCWLRCLVGYASNGDRGRLDAIMEALNNKLLMQELYESCGNADYSEYPRRLYVIKRYLGDVTRKLFTYLSSYIDGESGTKGIISIHVAGLFCITDEYGGMTDFEACATGVCDWSNNQSVGVNSSDITIEDGIECKLTLSPKQTSVLIEQFKEAVVGVVNSKMAVS